MTSLIDELPTGGGVGMVIEDSQPLQQPMQQPPQPMQQQQSQQPMQPMQLDQEMINQIVNGIQQATLTGATSLPSRDIPMTTDTLTQDHTARPNYIPKPESRHYIEQEQDRDWQQQYQQQQWNRQHNQQHAWDTLYDQIQTPLLIGVLYFFFQLPIFKQTLYRYAPFLCHLDGNLNLKGLLFSCGLFGSLVYTLKHIGLAN